MTSLLVPSPTALRAFVEARDPAKVALVLASSTAIDAYGLGRPIVVSETRSVRNVAEPRLARLSALLGVP